jgi:hypothetical protein
MSGPRLRPGSPGVRRAGWTLAGLGLLLAGLAGTAPAPRAGEVIARLGPITVTAGALHPGPGGTLTASVQVSTSGQPSDQLDAAIAADGAPESPTLVKWVAPRECRVHQVGQARALAGRHRTAGAGSGRRGLDLDCRE